MVKSFKQYLTEGKDEGYALLDKWYKAGDPEWGGKGYLIDRLAKELNISKSQAAKIHAQWASNK